MATGTTKSILQRSPSGSGRGDVSLLESMSAACARLSNERYQAFIENIEEGVYEVDIHGNYIYFNNALCVIFGYPREEIQFQNYAKFMDKEQAKVAYETFNTIYRTEQGVSDLVWKIIDRHGEERIIELSANLITDQQGKKIGFRGIARDITDRFKTQEALRKSEQRYRTLLDFVPYPIVVFTLDGKVSYLNPSFTEKFGWTLQELEGKTIPYVPAGLEQETSEGIERLFKERAVLRHETQRLTKDGRILDVVMGAALFFETWDSPSGELVILRDITMEKRIARNNEAILRIGMALPEYPDLDELLDYISSEIKTLLDVEGALVILLDEEKNELFFKSGVHDDSYTEKRAKEIRWPVSGIAGKVIRTGKSIIVPDTSKDQDFNAVVDMEAGFRTRSLLDVPLRSREKIIGVLFATNKKTGTFDETDVELLNMIAGTVALSIENARISEERKAAYKEVASLNRAKDKVINHLSHELKTPLSVLSASLNILEKRLSSLPESTWHPTFQRAKRNLERLLEIQYEAEDIMRDRSHEAHYILSRLLNECGDELTSLVAEEVGEGGVVERVRRRIDEIFGLKLTEPEDIALDQFLPKTLAEITPHFAHRKVEVTSRFEPTPIIRIPVEALRKVVVGLIRNAVENTPDEGHIEVYVTKKGKGAELVVRDYGVGITEENQKRIFEGFFVTQETMDYSSKRPYDFDAGGKGADLLRMKIFSERYNFRIQMTSSRCRYIPSDKDKCPGRISRCGFCNDQEDCRKSGGTTFTVFFPAASESIDV